MKNKPNILVVCARNKRRSKTAEMIFNSYPEFKIRSAGLSPKSPSQISRTKLEWSDLILVMEEAHKKRIKKSFRDIDLPTIDVLHIPDDYKYMEPELIDLLQETIPLMIQKAFPEF